ncbi:methyl-accepting chemotaxis protein [Desulfococcaceae bacterium HSG8]|nr:methyl-accepting chemotaxis protein [Desulfococcaceae bacterium HSG8]
MIKLDWTIKRMLTGMGLTGVLVIIVLAWTSINYSNTKLMKSHKQLAEIVMPLDAASQGVRIAAMNFTLHNYAILEAKNLEELGKLVERKSIEEDFSKGIKDLRALSERAANEDGKMSDLIEEVEKLYKDTLDKDTLISESVQNNLKLEEKIKAQVAVLDKLGSDLHNNAKALSEKISDAVSKHADEKEEAAEEPGTEELTRIHKVSNDLRLAIVFMTNYGHQMLLAGEQEKIIAIRDDKMIRWAGHAEASLEALSSSSFVNSPTELKEMIQSIKKDYTLLKSVLTEGENSVGILKGQWLAEQKNIDLLNISSNETANALAMNLKNIKSSAENIRNLSEKEAVQVSATSELVILVVSAAAILFMIVIGALITRRIVIPINKAVDFAGTIARGDLSAEIEKDHDDEVGNLVSKMSEMAHSLNSLIGQVQQSGIQVTSSATELSAVSKQQEAVMRTQLESTNEVVKSVGEISNVSEDLVDTMQRVAAMSEQTAEFASSGQSDLAHMEEAMHHMENASKSISNKLEAINEKAANITSVVTTITKVADQTNLLSLNAAIEAEKAGEYGRGFTVVAREIRRLADQTAVATLDIDQMVQEMQSAVSAGVMEMDAFIAEVQRSAENVGKISMQLSRIIEQVQGLSPSFEGVNESMQFQFGKAQHINNSMVGLSEEMRQTVDSLRESFMAIEQLNDAASGLQDEVSRFKVM